MKCPLCENCHSAITAIIKLDIAGKRDFYCCRNCYIIFVSDAGKLDFEREKERYLLHQNKIGDRGYVEFLKRALDPSLPFLRKDMQGLDYGCGHAPVLAFLLQEKGYDCDLYDPFFFPSIKRGQYDFIFATEVVEHFFNPAKEFRTIDQLLLPGGYLIVMTSFWKEIELFGSWYYKNDPAHVAFYHYKTFQFIAKMLNYKIQYTDREKVLILQKI